jgi:molybdate transport system permease protein
MLGPFTGDDLEALQLSLRISLVAIACALPFAVMASVILVRYSFPGKSLVNGIVHLPLVLPPVVVGYLLLVIFGTRGPVGHWLLAHLGLRFVFSWTGAALASAIITFPFQVRAMRLALEAVDQGLHQAAQTLGAGALDRFVSITLPLAMPGLIAGAITAFAASLGEFGAIITFVSNIPGETRTLPLAIYTAIQEPGGEAEAARLACLSIGIAFAGLMLSEIAARHVRRVTGQ